MGRVPVEERVFFAIKHVEIIDVAAEKIEARAQNNLPSDGFAMKDIVHTARRYQIVFIVGEDERRDRDSPEDARRSGVSTPRVHFFSQNT